jgi:hypothetical protein
MWGASPTDEEIISGFGLFDKLIIEERETWTAELWRSSGNARGTKTSAVLFRAAL